MTRYNKAIMALISAVIVILDVHLNIPLLGLFTDQAGQVIDGEASDGNFIAQVAAIVGVLAVERAKNADA